MSTSKVPFPSSAFNITLGAGLMGDSGGVIEVEGSDSGVEIGIFMNGNAKKRGGGSKREIGP